MRRLARALIVGLPFAFPVQSCTLISEVDRDQIGGGTGPRGGHAGMGGAAGGRAGQTNGGGGASGQGGASAGRGDSGAPATEAGAAGSAGAGGEISDPSDGGQGGVGGEPPMGGSGGAEACDATVCGGDCVDTSQDIAHCGSCDRPCNTEHVDEVLCSGGRCKSSCEPGYGNCSQPPILREDDGCETNFRSRDTCGTSCGDVTKCAEGELCVDGACQPESACTSPLTACGEDCVDLDEGLDQGDDVLHCGECDHSCSDANATAACASGVCTPVCSQGYADCSTPPTGSADDGCETNIETGTTAGAAITDCGACGRTCSAMNATAVECSGGECAPTCSAGFADCLEDDGTGADDGCETQLSTGVASGPTFARCGACGVTCSLDNAESAACNSGSCVPACDDGFADCNAESMNDGCETNQNTDTDNCGACGRACVGGAGTSEVLCASGECAPTCQAGYGDCNVDEGSGPDDGCDTNLWAQETCGLECGAVSACDPLEVCNEGTCEAAAGLAVLSVPLDEADQVARYVATYPEEAQPNLVNAAVTFRVYAPGAAGGSLRVNLLDADSTPGAETSVPLLSLATGWTDVTWSAGTAAGAFDPSAISQLLIEVQAGATGPWTEPTLVYVDSIRASNGDVDESFTTAVAPLVASATVTVPGATVSHVNGFPPP